MTLLECISIAKTLQYVPPAKPFDQFTFDEICFAALNEILKNEIVVYCAILTCQKYSIMKPMLKATLKDYIKEYGNENMIPGKK